MNEFGKLAEELRGLGVEPPELLAASGLLVWRCSAGKDLRLGHSESRRKLRSPLAPLSVRLSTQSLYL